MSETKAPSGARAVVIGSGLGGLAAAVRLGVKGYTVTVLERNDQVGGRARVHALDGYVFDAGPTVVTAPFLFEELWTLCGKTMSDDIDMRPVDPFYRIRFHDGSVFNYNGDPEHMRREVARFNPDDVEGYERFVRTSEAIFKVGFEQLAHVPFPTVGSMLRIVPDMVKLQSYRTVYGLVSKYFKDDRLRQVMSFHPLLVGGNPFSTTSIYTLIAFLERKWGVHFPMGGTGALVKGIVTLIEGQGGEVRTNAEVKQILVRDGQAKGVELANGERIEADVVVSNADAAWTYRYLVAPEHRRAWTDEKIERARYSMSLVVWYFGTKRKYPDVAHHTILLGPRYKELLTDIFDRKVLAEDFSLYLHRPTATDPSLAPEGHEGFYVLSPVPHLDAGIDWRRARRALPPGHREVPLRVGAPGPRGEPHGEPHDHPAGLSRRAPGVQGRGVQHRAGADPERVVSPAQRQRRRARALPRGRGNPPRRGDARGALVRAGARHRGARCPSAMNARRRTSRGAARSSARAPRASTPPRSSSPSRVRGPASVIYAFCRVADDAVDLVSPEKAPAALDRMRARLHRVYADRPDDHPVDRALAAVVQRARPPEGGARGAARRLPVGRGGAPLRVPRRAAGILRPRGVHRGRDDDRADGTSRPSRARPGV